MIVFDQGGTGEAWTMSERYKHEAPVLKLRYLLGEVNNVRSQASPVA